jgi:hypothetical protein
MYKLNASTRYVTIIIEIGWSQERIKREDKKLKNSIAPRVEVQLSTNNPDQKQISLALLIYLRTKNYFINSVKPHIIVQMILFLNLI